MTPEEIVRVILIPGRLRHALTPLVREARMALDLARGHEAEGAHALALRERGDAQRLAERAHALLFGAALGNLVTYPPEMNRPIEHECARVIRQAIEAGSLEEPQ